MHTWPHWSIIAFALNLHLEHQQSRLCSMIRCSASSGATPHQLCPVPTFDVRLVFLREHIYVKYRRVMFCSHKSLKQACTSPSRESRRAQCSSRRWCMPRVTSFSYSSPSVWYVCTLRVPFFPLFMRLRCSFFRRSLPQIVRSCAPSRRA